MVARAVKSIHRIGNSRKIGIVAPEYPHDHGPQTFRGKKGGKRGHATFWLTWGSWALRL